MQVLSTRTPVGVLIAVVFLFICAGGVQGGVAVVRESYPTVTDALLAKADSVTTATLTARQVTWRSAQGGCFAVTEWIDPVQPPLLVVSDGHLPVEPQWTVDMNGRLLKMKGTRHDGVPVTLMMMVVVPENVLVYCYRSTGKPCTVSPTTLDPGLPI